MSVPRKCRVSYYYISLVFELPYDKDSRSDLRSCACYTIKVYMFSHSLQITALSF